MSDSQTEHRLVAIVSQSALPRVPPSRLVTPLSYAWPLVGAPPKEEQHVRMSTQTVKVEVNN